MSEQLKPVNCGCGGEAWTDYIIGEPSEGVGWFVCCKNCEIQLPPEYDTEAEAVETWNRAMGERMAKATRKPTGFFYRCECGYVLCCEKNDMNYCPACGGRLIWGE